MTSHHRLLTLINLVVFLFTGLIGIGVYNWLWLADIVSLNRRPMGIAILLIGGFACVLIVLCSERCKKHLVFIAWIPIALEIFLQVIAFFGFLPGVSFYVNAPYARMYYQSAEGLGNSRTNNYGWHYLDLKLEEDSEKILLVGDSFIEARQVAPRRHLGKRLEAQFYADGNGTTHEVIAIGLSGFGPAQYFELMQYGIDHFHLRRL